MDVNTSKFFVPALIGFAGGVGTRLLVEAFARNGEGSCGFAIGFLGLGLAPIGLAGNSLEGASMTGSYYGGYFLTNQILRK